MTALELMRIGVPEEILLDRQWCARLKGAFYPVCPLPPVWVAVVGVHQDPLTGSDRRWFC